MLIFSLCFVIGLFLYLLPFFLPAKRGEQVLEKWEVVTKKNKIQVTAYAEKFSFVPGAYYVFESVNSLNEKTEIMTFRHDDPIPINKNGIAFVSDDVGYVFMGWKCAVTQDGGKTWSVWDAEKNLPQWKCCNYNLIDSIEMGVNGTGKMNINVISEKRGEVPTLYTKDYGKTWSISP